MNSSTVFLSAASSQPVSRIVAPTTTVCNLNRNILAFVFLVAIGLIGPTVYPVQLKSVNDCNCRCTKVILAYHIERRSLKGNALGQNIGRNKQTVESVFASR